MNNIPRRTFHLLGAGAAIGAMMSPREAEAMGRTPLGGSLSMSVPLSVATLDPHDLGSPAAALFSEAVFDTLYARDPKGRIYSALATDLPKREAGSIVVRIRPGLRASNGRSIGASDVLFSLRRTHSRGGAAALRALPTARLHLGGEGIAFAGASAEEVAQALASPLCAVVPKDFRPSAPIGTGAFSARIDAGVLSLERNTYAARGPSFLSKVVVRSAADLRESLRRFESERDDLGWLGAGLFDQRRGAQKFQFDSVGWVVLVTGAGTGGFGAPGAAQRLADGIERGRIAHLGLGGLPPGSGAPRWKGEPTSLLVDRSNAQFVEVARAVALALSQVDHEVKVEPVGAESFRRRRDSLEGNLAIDFVRRSGPSATDAYMSLATAESVSRARVKRPPAFAASTLARAVTTSLRVGVLGELLVSGAHSPKFTVAASSSGGWDLGASHTQG